MCNYFLLVQNYDSSRNPVINYMSKVVDELKSQMQNIQYYSLLQKLFISYIFKHLENQIDSVNKNPQMNNNCNNMYKSQNKFNSNGQFPFFGACGQDIDFFSMNNTEIDQMNFIKQMQSSGFNIGNYMNGNNNPYTIPNNISINPNFPNLNNNNNMNNLSSIGFNTNNNNKQINQNIHEGIFSANTPSNIDPNILNQMQNQFSNPINNPIELLKNLNSSINCQIGQYNTNNAQNLSSKQNNSISYNNHLNDNINNIAGNPHQYSWESSPD